MPKTVISDSSTLIVFQKIGEFDILNKVYGELITTHGVAKEFGDSLPDWIRIQAVSDKKYQVFQKLKLIPEKPVLSH